MAFIAPKPEDACTRGLRSSGLYGELYAYKARDWLITIF